MADNRKRTPRGGKQAASGSRPIRRNERAATPKGQRERTQAARPQRDRNRDAVQVPKGEFIEGRRAAAEALRTGFPVKCALIAEGGVPGADEGYAIAYLYEVDDEGAYTFESEAAYIGEAPNFMAALKEPVAYTDDEIDERYRDEEADAEGDDAEEAEEVADTVEKAEEVVEDAE